MSKPLLGKFQNHSQISILNPENYCIPCRHRLLDQATLRKENKRGRKECGIKDCELNL